MTFVRKEGCGAWKQVETALNGGPTGTCPSQTTAANPTEIDLRPSSSGFSMLRDNAFVLPDLMDHDLAGPRCKSTSYRLAKLALEDKV